MSESEWLPQPEEFVLAVWDQTKEWYAAQVINLHHNNTTVEVRWLDQSEEEQTYNFVPIEEVCPATKAEIMEACIGLVKPEVIAEVMRKMTKKMFDTEKHVRKYEAPVDKRKRIRKPAKRLTVSEFRSLKYTLKPTKK